MLPLCCVVGALGAGLLGHVQSRNARCYIDNSRRNKICEGLCRLCRKQQAKKDIKLDRMHQGLNKSKAAMFAYVQQLAVLKSA